MGTRPEPAPPLFDEPVHVRRVGVRCSAHAGQALSACSSRTKCLRRLVVPDLLEIVGEVGVGQIADRMLLVEVAHRVRDLSCVLDWTR